MTQDYQSALARIQELEEQNQQLREALTEDDVMEGTDTVYLEHVDSETRLSVWCNHNGVWFAKLEDDDEQYMFEAHPKLVRN